jgi:hypothetical protein
MNEKNNSMAEQPASATPTPPLPAAATIVARAADFRIFSSNFFRLRLGPGETTIVFCTATDVPAGMPLPVQVPGRGQTGAQFLNVIQEDFAVTVTWPVLKTLLLHAGQMLEAIEKEIGPIRSLKSTTSQEKAIERYRQVVRATLPENP